MITTPQDEGAWSRRNGYPCDGGRFYSAELQAEWREGWNAEDSRILDELRSAATPETNPETTAGSPERRND